MFTSKTWLAQLSTTGARKMSQQEVKQNGKAETTHTSTVLRMPSSSPTCGSYPNTRRAFSILCHRCAHVNATRKRVKVGSRPDNQPNHSDTVASAKPTVFGNTRGSRAGYVSGVSMRHSRRGKSQK